MKKNDHPGKHKSILF